MAYYGAFPATYQPVYQAPQYQAPAVQPQFQQQYQAPQQAQQTNGGVSIVQIQGEASAKSYLVAPNTTVQLWDVENGVIYIKSADGSGMPSMKVLDYKVRGEAIPQQAATAPEYATKGELTALEEKIKELKAEISRKKTARPVKEDDDE